MIYNTHPVQYIGIRQVLTVRGGCVFYASHNANAPIGAFESNEFAERCLKLAGFVPHVSERGHDWYPPKRKLQEPLQEVVITASQAKAINNILHK